MNAIIHLIPLGLNSIMEIGLFLFPFTLKQFSHQHRFFLSKKRRRKKQTKKSQEVRKLQCPEDVRKLCKSANFYKALKLERPSINVEEANSRGGYDRCRL